MRDRLWGGQLENNGVQNVALTNCWVISLCGAETYLSHLLATSCLLIPSEVYSLWPRANRWRTSDVFPHSLMVGSHSLTTVECLCSVEYLFPSRQEEQFLRSALNLSDFSKRVRIVLEVPSMKWSYTWAHWRQSQLGCYIYIYIGNIELAFKKSTNSRIQMTTFNIPSCIHSSWLTWGFQSKICRILWKMTKELLFLTKFCDYQSKS